MVIVKSSSVILVFDGVENGEVFFFFFWTTQPLRCILLPTPAIECNKMFKMLQF